MVVRALKGFAVAGAACMLAVAPASAATILVFGQNGIAHTITATANTPQTQTTIKATGAQITITGIDASGVPTPLTAYLTLTAFSTSGVATGVDPATNKPWLQQAYSGTFSITSTVDPLASGNVNYLSGSFSGMDMGIGQQTAITSSSPDYALVFTSDVISNISSPASLGFTFTDLSPSVSQCGDTLCGFTGSVSGNFSGSSAVPEPASWALMVGGFGMLGATMRRRRPTTAVSFG